MANKGFNGTTVTLNAQPLFAAATDIRSVEFSESSARVRVSGSGDSMHTDVPGIPEVTCTVTGVGSSSVEDNTSGTLVVTWFDGVDSESISNCAIFEKSTSGDMDGEITTTYVIGPSVA